MIKKYLFTIAIIISLLMLCFPNQNVSAAGGTISGYVRDINGNPLSGFVVLSHDGTTFRSYTTSSNGYYILTNVPSTSNHLRASGSTGYAFEHYWGFQVANGGNYTVNFTMRLGGGQICGKVIGQNGAGLANIPINVYEKVPAAQQAAWVTAMTTSTGDYCTSLTDPSIGPGLPTGSYVVQASGATTVTHDNVNVNAGRTTSNINLSFLAGSGSISGVVTDTNSGATLANAEIFADGGDIQATAVTDANGTYLLSNLPDRSFNVLVTMSSYANAHKLVMVSNSAAIKNINFQLTNQKGSLSGKITDYITGQPIQGVNVFMDSDQGTGYGSVQTDANGFYSIADLAPMDYYVHVSKSGYASQIRIETVNNGTICSNVNFYLGNGNASISGKVLKDGQPAAYANVYTNSSSTSSKTIYGNTMTDVNGNYTIPNLVPGQYDIQVSDVAGYPNQIYFFLPVSSSITQNFNLTNGTSTISGYVADEFGRPVVGVTIQPFNNANPGTWGTAETDVNGNYVIHNLWAGQYTVFANAAGFTSISKNSISASSNATTTVNFVLDQVIREMTSLPSDLSLLAKSGNKTTSEAMIAVTTGGIANWTASASDPWVFLGPNGNQTQISGQSGTFLKVWLDPDKVSGTGIFTASIVITCPDAATSYLDVTMVKVNNNIKSVYIPMILR